AQNITKNARIAHWVICHLLSMRGKNWPEILIGGGTKNRRDYTYISTFIYPSLVIYNNCIDNITNSISSDENRRGNNWCNDYSLGKDALYPSEETKNGKTESDSSDLTYAREQIYDRELAYGRKRWVYTQKKTKTTLAMKRLPMAQIGGDPASYIPAHTSPAAAASFRT
ncbi:hypothetical protein KP17_12885, partial [Pectobacterium parvum]